MLSFLLSIIVAVNGQECLIANNSNGLPPLQDYRLTNLRKDAIRHQHQAIIPSYKFECCGHITQWGADINGRQSSDMAYTLDFQVWRPSFNTSSTDCYSLVGNNRFTSVLTTNGTASSLTPLANDTIHFQPGDVLGFYVESARNSPENRGVVILRDRNVRGDGEYQSELVWFAKLSNVIIANPACPFPVGPSGVLDSSTNAAPVISLSVSTTMCPSVLPTQTNKNMDNNVNSGQSATLAIIVAPIVSVIIIITLTLLVGLAVCLKVRQNRKNEVYIDRNEVCGIGLQNMATYAENMYDHPTMDQQTVEPFDIKGNEAYATVIETKENEAYATSTMIKSGVASATKMHHHSEERSSNMERKNEVSNDHNEAYGIGLQNMATYAENMYDHPTMDQQTVEPFDIKGNEAYATVIETKENEAYATNTMIKPGVASATKMHHHREERSSNMERSNI